MANTIVITKLPNGNIEVLKSGVNPRTHTSTYSCRSTATGIVQVVDESTRVVIDTYDPVDVEKVVSTDGGEVFISDVSTLYTQLSTYFFFKPSVGGGLTLEEQTKLDGLKSSILNNNRWLTWQSPSIDPLINVFQHTEPTSYSVVTAGSPGASPGSTSYYFTDTIW